MLFDLRGRRRRTVQVVYATLAILMGGGLVLFGIGGDVQGGIVDAFRDGSTATEDLFEERIEEAQETVRANPENAAAWAALAKLRYQQAGTGENFDSTTGIFTEGGRAELARSETAWNRYLALEPEELDDQVASLMVQAFGPAGLDKPAEAVKAMEIVVDSRDETPALYAQLAVYAYTAGQVRKGDLAGAKAIELAKPEDRAQLEAQIDAAKQQAGPAGAAAGGGQSAPLTPEG